MKLLADIYEKDVTGKDYGNVDRNKYFERIVAKSIIVRSDGKIAIQCFRDLDFYMLPGGMKEQGENVEEAAVREAAEETGFKIKLIKGLGLVREIRDRQKQISLNYCFLARPVGKQGKLNLTKKEAKHDVKFFWLNVDNALEKMRLMSDTKSETNYIINFIHMTQRELLIMYKDNKL